MITVIESECDHCFLYFNSFMFKVLNFNPNLQQIINLDRTNQYSGVLAEYMLLKSL